MTRPEMLARLRNHGKPFDLLVIGGGATGMGIAVDAASRNYDVLLMERSDFGKGTSSRSTKLLHGGIRYLEQGNFPLVFEALKERGLLLQNAPRLVTKMPFVVPSYRHWDRLYFGAGLTLYSLLARQYSFGPTRVLSAARALAEVPNLKRSELRGGVLYYDGQFDDMELLIALARTAAKHGATILNYFNVTSLLQSGDGKVTGATARDVESDEEFRVEAQCVINATGPFCDSIRAMGDPHVKPMVSPSQGIHLVVDGSFLSGTSAMVVPRTSDGRVMFAIPWHGHTLLGTTDTPIPKAAEEPQALESEIQFVLETASRYLHRAPTRADVLSVFAGIRPLIRSKDSMATAALSRDHSIHSDPSGLITITGGKWTTYRHMAEMCLDHAISLDQLPSRPCVTRDLPIDGADGGSEPGRDTQLHADLPYTMADVRRAVRREMARTLEDVLGRRTRALFLRSRAAMEMAPVVADVLSSELGWSPQRRVDEIARFDQVAAGYTLPA